jgi:hypothetical protein
MFMQTVNRTDTERVWVTVTNNSGADIGVHDPVFKYTTAGNASSVAVNEGASLLKAGSTDNKHGHLIGIAYEDIPNGTETGLVQVYGYYESVRLAPESGVKAIKQGTGLRVPSAASVGFSSVGLNVAEAVNVVALSEITQAQINADPGYGDHVFIRAL